MKHAARALGLLLCVLGIAALAAGPDDTPPVFAPAQFGTHPGSLVDRLRMPDQVPGGDFDVVVLCQVHVYDNGSFGSAWCAPPIDSGTQTFHAEMMRALSGARFLPARIGGAGTGVIMPSMGRFRCAAGICTVEFRPNLGVHQAEFGPAYSAPQIIASDARPAIEVPGTVASPDLSGLESLSFIPGFVNGQAVSMRWFGMLLYRVGR